MNNRLLVKRWDITTKTYMLKQHGWSIFVNLVAVLPLLFIDILETDHLNISEPREVDT